MSDAEGWDCVYANAKPKKEKRTQICFTGFSVTEKLALLEHAAQARIEVVGSVTKHPALLCAGENAGPVKLQKARVQGTVVLSRADFMHLLENGEIRGSDRSPVDLSRFAVGILLR